MTDNLLIRDASTKRRFLRATDVNGVHVPHHFIEMAEGPVGIDHPMPVRSLQKKFRDSFSQGNELNATKWHDPVVGAGMTVTQANNMLTITTGTNADAETVLVSRETFSVPYRAMLGFLISQRIGRQTVIFEAVSVDPVTLEPDERWVASWRYAGTSATTASYDVKSGSTSPFLRSAFITMPSTASLAVAEIEPFADECWFHGRAIDSTAGRANSYVRHQQIPDANELYKIRIRVLNKGILSVTGCVTGTGNVVRLTVSNHGLSTGDKVKVSNVNGVAAANVTNATITVVDANTIELNSTVFAGTFVNDGYAVCETTTIAPASNTSVQLQFINVVDYAELTAEITAGRGSTAAGQGISATLAGGLTTATITAAANSPASVAANVGNFANLSSTVLAAGATYTGSVLSPFSASFSNMQTGYLLVSVLNHAGTTGAHGTLSIETYDTTSTTTPTTGQRLTYSVPVPSDNLMHTFLFPLPTKYFRILFRNNASVTQTAFNLSYATRFAGGGDQDIERNIPFLLSTTALGASATFTSTGFDFGVSRLYQTMKLVANPDQAGTLAFEQSYDGTTWLRTHSQAVAANGVVLIDAPILMRYTRVVYINGGVAQTTFRLHATVTG